MLRRILTIVVVNVAVTIGLVMMAEGASSLTLKIWDSLKKGISVRDNRVVERAHTRYDPELGWVNLPRFHDPNLYGPGLDLQTNAQGFRERQDTAPAPVPGTTRVFCIGDSFTLGFGVGNDYTWCHYLEGMQPALETVNMGQGGYGVDQAYLWYKRDGAPFRHDVVILAIVDVDIERMRSYDFYGYPKPFLARKDDRLVVTNSPLPETPYAARSVRLNTFISQFEIFRFVDRIAGKVRRDVATPSLPMNWQDATAVLEGILDGIAATPGVVPVVVYLPTTFDDDSEAVRSAENRGFLAAATAARAIRFIDLVADRDRIRRAAAFPDLITESHGHYTEVANNAVARVLYEDIATSLATRPAASTPD